MSVHHNIAAGVGAGFVAFLVLLLVVWATGSTFGQRCAAMGHVGAAWENCVYRLARGESE